MKELKKELKKLAKKIRKTKNEIREGMRNGDYMASAQYKVEVLRYGFRHKHIVYCLMRGRKREEIESRVVHKPDEDYIKDLLIGYENHRRILAGELKKSEKVVKKKLYVLVDETLPKSYAAVQGTHAVAEYLLKTLKKKEKEHRWQMKILRSTNPEDDVWENNTLVVLKAPYATIKQCEKQTLENWVAFKEPDLEDRLTAVAAYINCEHYVVRNLSLL